MLVQDSCFFHDNLAVYKSFGGIVLAADEGANIAAAMGSKKKTAILQVRRGCVFSLSFSTLFPLPLRFADF